MSHFYEHEETKRGGNKVGKETRDGDNRGIWMVHLLF